MYEIQFYKNEYLKQVDAIANHQFGKHYISAVDWDDEDRIMLVAVRGAEVLGFCTAMVLEYKDLTLSELYAVFTDRPVGMIKSLAVRPDEMNRGIGSKLFEASLAWLGGRGVSQFYTEAWRDEEGGVRVEKIVLKNNFTKLIEKEDYWYKESLERDYQCSVCGQPCRCNAVVYYRRS